jgi:hypothetical protein
MNDTLGDCTCAGAGHQIMAWTANAGKLAIPADADILNAYETITGYTPSDPSTDQGAVELDVLKYWRGTGIAGHRIGAFAAIPVKRQSAQRYAQIAINLFGGIYIGLSLPQSATSPSDVWDVVPNDEIEGGHAVNCVAYDADFIYCVTWGQIQKMTWEFYRTYCDEAYAIISADFLNGQGQTPEGFNLDQLNRDLQAVAA